MVNRDGKQVSPPVDEALEVTLWRIREGVRRQFTGETAGRLGRRRVWFGLAAAAVLFGAGITVSAGALPNVADSAAVLKVVCYGSATPNATSFAISYVTKSTPRRPGRTPSACAPTRARTLRSKRASKTW